GRATRPTPAATTPAPGVSSPGRRVPDLSALPPLLHASGAFEALRQRLGPPAAPPPTGRHAGVTSVPHGAKTYLAAALAMGTDGVAVGTRAGARRIGPGAAPAHDRFGRSAGTSLANSARRPNRARGAAQPPVRAGLRAGLRGRRPR